MRTSAELIRSVPLRKASGGRPTIRRFSTDDVVARERLDYWREAICDVFVALDCRSANRRGFGGHVTSEPLEDLHLSEVRAESQHVVRGRRQLARASEDDFLLSVQMEGTGMVRQDGRDAVLPAGAMALYASTRPYELIFPGRFRQLVIQLPRAVLGAAVAQPDALTAQTLAPSATEARMFAAMLAALHGKTEQLHDASRAHVAAGVVASLAAALSALPATVPPAASEGCAAAPAHICAYVRAHLDDPHLSPSTIATALGFSRGHIHRIFAGEGQTLQRYIWRLRLERVRADLDNRALSGVPIAQLAMNAGFTSAEHFSRSFRAQYGSTALAFRRERLR